MATLRAAIAEARAAQRAAEERTVRASSMTAAVSPPTATPLAAPLSPALVPPSPTLLALARRGVTRSNAEGLASTRTGIAAASSAGKATLTDNGHGHHVNAMQHNEKHSRTLKATRTSSLGNKLSTAVTALAVTATKTATTRWTIALVALQYLMPRLNPQLREVALSCLAMLNSARFTLGSRLSVLAHSLTRAVIARVTLGVAPSLLTWSVDTAQDAVESLGQRVFVHGQTASSDTAVETDAQILMAAARALATPVGYVPALSDNGASDKASCSRSLDGAILSTHIPENKALGGASKNTSLAVAGSYVYVHDWLDATGRVTRRVRRFRHTADLVVPIVISEGSEVYERKASFTFTADTGRFMTEANGQVSPLFMNSVKLGWFKLKPVTDTTDVIAALTRATNGVYDLVVEGSSRDAAVHILGDGQPRMSVGMSGVTMVKLSGVPLLRYKHSIGHKSVRSIVLELQAEGRDKGCVTRSDIEQFVKEACGVCETAKAKRRAFTLRTIADHTVPPLGKRWIVDSLELRMPTAYHSYTYLHIAVCAASKVWVLHGMHGQSSTDIIRAREQLRAYVRPRHGEIGEIRCDSHPTHRGRKVLDYMIDESMGDSKSPPHVHEGVHLAENAFHHLVPAANAQLLCSSDLGESHFYSAALYCVAARNDAATVGMYPVTSPTMLYEERTNWRSSPLMPYAAAGKSLVHPETRDSKFDEHAVPCVYVGPAHNSASPVHCAVWVLNPDRYVDVDIGCVQVNPDEVLARTRRDHPSHQHFNQRGKQAAVAEPGMNGGDVLTALPFLRDELWTPTSVVPAGEYSLGICAGVPREGDIASWCDQLTRGRSGGPHWHRRIDLKAGGYAHNIEDPTVNAHLCQHAAGAVLVFLQLTCGPWSAARFRNDGLARPLFTARQPLGITDARGQVVQQATRARTHLRMGLNIASACRSKGGEVFFEHPVSQGAHSLFASKDCVDHVNLYDDPLFLSFAQTHGPLMDVYTDQLLSGASTRKATHYKCTAGIYPMLVRVLGVLRVTGDEATGEPLRGLDDKGAYRTRASEVYPPLLCERTAGCIIEYCSRKALAARGVDNAGAVDNADDLCNAGADTAAQAPADATERVTREQAELEAQNPGDEESVDDADANDNAVDMPSQSSSARGDLPFAVGDRVDVFWSKEKQWYTGTVTDCYLKPVRFKALGKGMLTPHVQVHYDTDGATLTHSMHNSEVKLAESPSLHSIMLAREFDQQQWEDGYADLAMPLHVTDLGETIDGIGGIVSVTDYQFDMETFELCNKVSVFAIAPVNGDLLASRAISEANAKHWHTPSNEREYERSPQKALWRTAKELKWSQYLELNMFEWVNLSSIDKAKHRIYSTLWAYKIKLHADSTFHKLNPRWCLKGGSMDRGIYKSHGETLRITTMRIILAVKAGYWRFFATFLLDCSNAFQSTRTDGPGSLEPLLYCWPAPGFEKRSTTGERMVCKVLVGMQGRIDATRMFTQRLFKMLADAGCLRTVWDSQLCIYHCGPLAKSDASLLEILTSISTATDSGPQEPPVGYALMGWHVDDSISLACDTQLTLDFNKNRVAQYINGSIQTVYATTMVGWHGNKALGFLLQCDAVEKRVTLSAPDMLERFVEEAIKDCVVITPKHIMTPEFEDVPEGATPEQDDPSRHEVVVMQSLCRHLLGVSIYMAIAYPQMLMPTNVLCSRMNKPHDRTLKCIRHMAMHMKAFPDSVSYCTYGVEGLEQPAELLTPFGDVRPHYFHTFVDANLTESSRTGGVGMLACGVIQPVSQRQHLKAACAHTSEVVAASTFLNLLAPTNGTLQELSIRRGMPTPFYVDSISTVFVATDDKAIKKSVWLIRRAGVLRDGVTYNDIQALHVPEYNNIADPLTKYLTLAVWKRHMHYLLNLAGALPAQASGKRHSSTTATKQS